MHIRIGFYLLLSEIRKMTEDKVGLVTPHFSFQWFNHTGGLAFHQGVKCLIFLLVSFFFSHNECKSKNVNKASPHHTHALLPPPASYPCSDLPASRGHRAPPLQVPVPAALPPLRASRASAGAPVSSREGDHREKPLFHRLHLRSLHHLHLSTSAITTTTCPSRLPRGVEVDPALKATARRSTETPDFYAPWKGWLI